MAKRQPNGVTAPLRRPARKFYLILHTPLWSRVSKVNCSFPEWHCYKNSLTADPSTWPKVKKFLSNHSNVFRIQFGASVVIVLPLWPFPRKQGRFQSQRLLQPFWGPRQRRTHRRRGTSFCSGPKNWQSYRVHINFWRYECLGVNQLRVRPGTAEGRSGPTGYWVPLSVRSTRDPSSKIYLKFQCITRSGVFQQQVTMM
jgi:hypothetical protein